MCERERTCLFALPKPSHLDYRSWNLEILNYWHPARDWVKCTPCTPSISPHLEVGRPEAPLAALVVHDLHLEGHEAVHALQHQREHWQLDAEGLAGVRRTGDEVSTKVCAFAAVRAATILDGVGTRIVWEGEGEGVGGG